MSNRYAELPFVRYNSKGTVDSYWNVQPTDSWAADNKTGSLYAIMLVNFMRRQNEPTLLATVCRDIPKYGTAAMGGLNGISIGFFHEIAKRAIG